MKKIITFTAVFFLVAPILAHEFWLQPEKFIYQPGEDINIRFWVGEDFDGTNWSGNNAKINSLQLYMNGITDDVSSEISEEKGDSLQLSFFDEGTAVVAFNSKNSFIELDSAKFNTYLKEDGLNDAIDYRIAHHEADSSGRELYQRSVKTLLQIGDTKGNISFPTRLPLDIIPLSNPYAVKEEDSLTIKLLFKKVPLVNQPVNVWQRSDGKTNRQQYQTNQKGEISFTISPAGKWMISTVKMIHLNRDPKASWQSYWGSCTWGYE